MCGLATVLFSFTAPVWLHGKDASQRLSTPDAAIGARVGASVAIDKNIIVVGAPDDDEAGPFAGAAYVFVRQGHTWEQSAKLLGPATSGFRSFGESVAVSHNVVVIGAPFDGPGGDGSGAVYVYVHNGSRWTRQARLTASDASANQLFGDAVAIDGSTLVVGAFLDGERAPNAGAAYVFTRKGSLWTQQAKLTASNASEFAFFGSAVAVKGDHVVVGAPTAETAYVFTQHGKAWTEDAVLSASDALEGDYSAFGAAVAIDHDTVLIGAPTEGHAAPETGAAYLFRRHGHRWAQDQKIIAPDGVGEDEFGTSVAIEGKQLVVGAPFREPGNQGALYIFDEHGHTWKHRRTLTADPTTAFLGSSVALQDDVLVGGAPAFVEFDGLQSAGGAYVFDRP